MNVPSPISHPKPEQQGDAMAALKSEIEGLVGRVDAAPKATLPPGSSAGRPPNFLWGPSNPRVTSPLQMLAEVADHGQRLHQEMLSLVQAVTGEAPPPLRLREVPRPASGLLPGMAHLAHEIETTHVDIARLIEHLRGRL